MTSQTRRDLAVWLRQLAKRGITDNAEAAKLHAAADLLRTNFARVKAFHRAIGQVPPAPPNLRLRRRLIREEAREVNRELRATANELADADGKVCKPPGYTPPHLDGIVMDSQP